MIAQSLNDRPKAGRVVVAGDAGDVRLRWLVFAICGAAFLVPVFVVRYPPVLDLAQQMAQLPLLEAALGEKAELYRVDWLAPNRISYPLLALGWWTGGAEFGPRIALALCILGVLGAIHALGAFLRRPIEHVVLASLFVWSSSLYGGFFNFQLGAWGLALWFRELTARSQDPARTAFVRAFLVAALLFVSHALWIPAAAGILVLAALFDREIRQRTVTARLVPLLFWLAVSWAWGRATVDPADAARIRYQTPISSRITDPAQWVSQALGGIKTAAEPLAIVALGAFALWMLLGWYRENRPRPGRAARLLAVAAGAFAVATLLLPDSFQETWFFARRWGAWAGVCATLALPALGRRRAWAAMFAAVVVTGVLVSTIGVWRRFDRAEMRGFEACRAAIHEGARVLFLDFDRMNPELWVFPTFQMAAYAQLDRDVQLSFSFAQHRSSLVRFRAPHHVKPWTRRLEHRPRNVQPADFDHFDLTLLHLPEWGVPTVQRNFPRLEPLAGDGEWRLYRVSALATPAAADPAPVARP